MAAQVAEELKTERKKRKSRPPGQEVGRGRGGERGLNGGGEDKDGGRGRGVNLRQRAMIQEAIGMWE